MFQPLYLFPSITLVSAFRTDITRKDIDTLKGLNWLNDEVINFYMQMIVERSQEHDNWPNVYAFNTFFYPKIMQQGHASVKRWTRKVGEGGVQAIDLILILDISQTYISYKIIILFFISSTYLKSRDCIPLC